MAFETHWITLRLDDFLWFASFEWAGDTETALYLHPYALSFALGYHDRIVAGTVPQYDEDLGLLDIYSTPARLTEQDRASRPHRLTTSFTFNSVDQPTQLTQALGIGEKVNDPKFGRRQVLVPGLRFEFVAFTRNGYRLPRVARLGKKRSPVVIEEAEAIVGRLFHGDARPDHAVNPLDVKGRVLRYMPVAVPPHVIFDRAQIEQDEFIRSGSRVIHIPARVQAWR